MSARVASISIAASILLMAEAFGASCPKKLDSKSFSGVVPWMLNEAVGYSTAKLAVDADGAPNSYRIDGNGLSFTCDGVVGIVGGKRVTPKSDPAHWQQVCRDAWAKANVSGDFSNVAIFGFLTGEQNKPVVQKEGDPLPNQAYISTTSMSVPGTPAGTQRHYVDAVEIPYVVMPESFLKAFKISPGDIAIVYRPKTQKVAFGVFADGGDLGEASVRLHQDLGADPMVTSGGISRAKRGIDDRVLTIVFPGQTTHGTTDAKAWREEIAKLGASVLDEFGGIDRLMACAK